MSVPYSSGCHMSLSMTYFYVLPCALRIPASVSALCLCSSSFACRANSSTFLFLESDSTYACNKRLKINSKSLSLHIVWVIGTAAMKVIEVTSDPAHDKAILHLQAWLRKTSCEFTSVYKMWTFVHISQKYIIHRCIHQSRPSFSYLLHI